MQTGSPDRVERRLAAILAADVAGYSRLMGQDEAGTARLVHDHRSAAEPLVAKHFGRVVKTTGDGVLIEFPSVVGAVQCAVAFQKLMAERNSGVAAERRVDWRVGIHLGDILIDGDDIIGDGVNLAARLEGIADPGGICISEDAFRQVRGKIEIDFLDGGEQALKNIAQPMRVYRAQPAAAPAIMSGSTTLLLPDKPSLVVLPFQNMTGDPEQEYFVDGMVEEITTAISRLPWLFVIARNSAFTYKGRAVGVKQIAAELGVRYVLEGSVRKAGNRVRITGQLIDTASGAHIWADRFDGALDDIFDLQDQVAASVAGAIEPKLRQSEIERAIRKPAATLGAYDLFLRAVAEGRKPNMEGAATALSLARQALSVDASCAPAASLLAAVRAQQIVAGIALPPEDIAEALRLARQAIDTSGNDPDSLSRGGFALALLGGEHAVAMRAIERALVLNPNSANAWHLAAGMHCYMNQPNEAIAAEHRAIRLSPLDPATFSFHFIMGQALMLAGRYEEAIEWVDRSLHDRPSYHPTIRGRVALCGYLGRQDEAREWIAKLLAVNPRHTIAWFHAYASRFMSPGTLAVLEEGLRRAGLPEE